MVETRRLNTMTKCPGCKTNVNPYVLEKASGDPPWGKLECPTCKEIWEEELWHEQ